MGPGLLDIDPTVLLFSPPPPGSPDSLSMCLEILFQSLPSPVRFGSGRCGSSRVGTRAFKKSYQRNCASRPGDKWPAPLPSASFLGWHLCVQGRTPQPPKICSETFRSPPVAFSKDISARTVFRGKSDHAFRRRGAHFFGRSANCVFQGCRKVGFHLGAILFLERSFRFIGPVRYSNGS